MKTSAFSRAGRQHLTVMLAVALLITAVAGAGLYHVTRLYVISQAEKNIQNLLLSHRGIHEYVQRTMHPALYKYKAEGKLPQDFYAPELFSSSYIVRNQNKYYNEAREKEGLQPIYYKMAAFNPRNPVNRANALEERLIREFNADRSMRSYREILEIDGKKYLYFAMPFLANEKRCMLCHGKREEAPLQLQELYPGEGGFNEKLGDIRAIESIRAPLQHEYFTVYIISGALLCGLISILALFFFSERLKTMVRDRTAELEREVAERQRAEGEVRQLAAGLEQRVQERTAQLEAANRELNAFAYSVSHDLRAPLRGIDGFSSALLEDSGALLDKTGQEHLQRIKNGCRRMGELIDGILRMSQLTRGEMRLQEVDLSEIADNIIEELRRADPERRTEVNIARDLRANGDPALLRALLANLLGNAWKFTRNTQDPAISFDAARQGKETVFGVRDNGAGFNMEYADNLFRIFHRLHAPGEFEGTGIGLATVQRIVHRHGGRIWANAEEGKGATFFFTLEPSKEDS